MSRRDDKIDGDPTVQAAAKALRIRSNRGLMDAITRASAADVDALEVLALPRLSLAHAAILAILALLASACCTPTIIRQPVPVTPAPCLSALPPDPPRVDAGDEAWVSYHVAMEGWAAAVAAECGAHLSGADGP